MTLRLTLLVRITVAWLIGSGVAVTPHIFPWVDGANALVPSSAVLLIGYMMGLPVLVIGAVCCSIWPREIARAPFFWAIGTLLMSWAWLVVGGIAPGIVTAWIGAGVSAALFILWSRLRPLDLAPPRT